MPWTQTHLEIFLSAPGAFLVFLRLFSAHLWRQRAPLAPPVWHAVRAEIAAAGLAIRQGARRHARLRNEALESRPVEHLECGW